MNKIKVILWDIDGTLLNFLEAEKCAIRKCFEIFGLGECTDKMLSEYSLINKKYWEILERGEMTKSQILEARFIDFFSMYNLDGGVAPAFNKEYQLQLGETVCFNDNGYELVKNLKSNYKQYAVTNGTKVAQDRKLNKSGLIDLFDGVFISDVIGFEKPSKEFFVPVLEELKAYNKEEILIVGDSLTSDMLGGNNISVLCCWYNPEHKENNKGVKVDFEIDDLQKLMYILNK